jgi:predicted peptidase
MLEPSSDRHTPRPLGETASPQGYWEYLPPTYDDATPHPLLVYLHGIAANGNGTTQLGNVLINGPAELIDDDLWPYDRPFVVLSPQHMGGGCPTPGEIQAFLAYAIDAYAVDPDQIYLTAISCGAFGAWDYLANYFDSQISAALLISGDGQGAFAYAGCALGVVPIWAFHGEADDLVDPQGTTVPMEALMACEPPPVDAQMTLFPGVRHEAWHQVYDLSSGHDVYAWLLSH